MAEQQTQLKSWTQIANDPRFKAADPLQQQEVANKWVRLAGDILRTNLGDQYDHKIFMKKAREMIPELTPKKESEGLIHTTHTAIDQYFAGKGKGIKADLAKTFAKNKAELDNAKEFVYSISHDKSIPREKRLQLINDYAIKHKDAFQLLSHEHYLKKNGLSDEDIIKFENAAMSPEWGKVFSDAVTSQKNIIGKAARSVNNIFQAGTRADATNLDMLGGVAGLLDLRDAWYELRTAAQELRKANKIDDATAKALGDATWDDMYPGSGWWSTHAAEVVLTAIPLIAGSIAAGTVAAETLPEVSAFSALAGRAALAGAARAPIESFMESAQAYNSIMDQTGDRKKAVKGAWGVFAKNVATLFLSDTAQEISGIGLIKMFKGSKELSKIAKIAKSTGAFGANAGIQTGQELLQNLYQTQALNDATGKARPDVLPALNPFSKENRETVMNSLAISGVTSAGMASVGHTMAKIEGIQKKAYLRHLVDHYDLPLKDNASVEEMSKAVEKYNSEKLAQQEKFEVDDSASADDIFVVNQVAKSIGYELGDLKPVKKTKKLTAIADSIEKALGKKIVFFKPVGKKGTGIGAQMVNNGNTIAIDVGTNNLFKVVIGHEVVHLIKLEHPDLYTEFKRSISTGKRFTEYKQKLLKTIKETNEDLGTNLKVPSGNGILEEYIADTVGDHMFDERMWNSLVSGEKLDLETNQASKKGIMQKVADIAESIVSRISNTTQDTVARKDFDKTKQVISNVLAQYNERRTNVLQEQTTNAADQQQNNVGTEQVQEAGQLDDVEERRANRFFKDKGLRKTSKRQAKREGYRSFSELSYSFPDAVYRASDGDVLIEQTNGKFVIGRGKKKSAPASLPKTKGELPLPSKKSGVKPSFDSSYDGAHAYDYLSHYVSPDVLKRLSPEDAAYLADNLDDLRAFLDFPKKARIYFSKYKNPDNVKMPSPKEVIRLLRKPGALNAWFDFLEKGLRQISDEQAKREGYHRISKSLSFQDAVSRASNGDVIIKQINGKFLVGTGKKGSASVSLPKTKGETPLLSQEADNKATLDHSKWKTHAHTYLEDYVPPNLLKTLSPKEAVHLANNPEALKEWLDFSKKKGKKSLLSKKARKRRTRPNVYLEDYVPPDVIKTLSPEEANRLENDPGALRKWLDSLPKEHKFKLEIRKYAKNLERSGIPKKQAEALRDNVEMSYEPMNLAEAASRVDSMSPDELRAAVDNMANLNPNADISGNIGVLAYGKIIMDKLKNDENIDADAIELAKNSTMFGQLIRQIAVLYDTNPVYVATTIEKTLEKGGREKLSEYQKAKLRSLTKNDIENRQLLKKAERELLKNPDDEQMYVNFDKVLNASEEASVALIGYTQRMAPKEIFKTLSALLKGNLLSPISQMSNVTGNVFYMPLMFGERTVGGYYDFLRHKLTGKKRTTIIPTFKAIPHLFTGVKKGWKEANRVWRTGVSPNEGFAGEIHTTLHPVQAAKDVLSAFKTMDKQKLRDLPSNILIASLGQHAAPMLRLLSFADLPVKRMYEAYLLYEQAVLNGMSDSEIRAAVVTGKKMRSENGNDIVSDVIKKERREEAASAVFQSGNMIADFYMGAVARARRKVTPRLQGLYDFFFDLNAPYKLTPSNLITLSLEFSTPELTFARAAYNASKGNHRKASILVGKAIVGNMMKYAARAIVMAGLQGSPFANEKRKDSTRYMLNIPQGYTNISGILRLATGRDPKTRKDDIIIRSEFLGFFGIQLLMWQDIQDKALVVNPNAGIDKDSFVRSLINIDRAIPSFGTALSELQMIKGTTNLMLSLKGERTFVKYFNTLAREASFIPVPSTVDAILRARASEIRTDYPDDFSGIPLSVYRKKISEGRTVIVDALGGKVPRTPKGRNPWVYHLFDNSKFRYVRGNHLIEELYKVYKATGKESALPSKPSRVISIHKKLVPLTNDQYMRFQTYVGKERKKLLERAFKSPYWKKKSPQEQLDALKSIYKRGYNKAKIKISREIRRGK